MSGELDEIWALYADDGGQALDAVEQSLLELKETPSNAAHVAALFRGIHTFKGNARVLGLETIEKCAHAAEDLIGLVRDENVPLDPDLHALLLEASDVLREMMAESLTRRSDVSPETSKPLISRIEAKIEECRAAQRGEAEQEAEPEAIVFAPVEPARLAQDAGYIQVFGGIASDAAMEARAVRAKLQAGEAADLGILAPSLEQLRFAADRLGLPGWAELTDDFLARSPCADDLDALILGIERLMPGGIAEEPSAQPAWAAPLPEPEEAPAAAPERAAGPAEASASNLPALCADPTYRAIFLDTVRGILSEMRAALGDFEVSPQETRTTLRSHVDRLLHAAKQIGMPGWPELLADFPGDSDFSVEEVQDFIAKVEAQAVLDSTARGLATPIEHKAEEQHIREFFDRLPPLLASVSDFGSTLETERPADTAGFLGAIGEIGSMAASFELHHIAGIAERLAGERNPAAFRRLELTLFEELSALQQAMPPDLQGTAITPAAVLENWCADQAYDTLLELNKGVDEMHKAGGATGQCEDAIQQFHLIYHACRHYRMHTAAHLCMALIDLFARAQDEGTPPDPMLLRITGLFVADLEKLFDTIDSGGTPDMAVIEQLFEEAASAAFTASGTASSQIIERRLGLPKSFRKVLTPESVKAAVKALDEGQRFYIIRAALNDDEEAAGRFLQWIDAKAATVISNITVFGGQGTLFDFLVATPLNETELAESLALLDPARVTLRIEKTLTGSQSPREQVQEARGAGEAGAQGAAATTAGQDLVSRGILEGIGEIVTGQAMVYRMLGDIAGGDLLRTVESEMQKAGGDWSKAKGAVQLALENFAGHVEKVYQAEAQLGTQLERLQEQAIAVRSRPATLLIKPLEAFAEATARQNGRQIDLKVSGADLVLDHDMLEDLKPLLRTLTGFCVTQSIEPPKERTASGKEARGKLRLSLAVNDESAVATVEDDGIGLKAIEDGDSTGDFLAKTRAALRSRGGALRVEPAPGGGVRFQVTLPMAMVVLDGMVVRVDEYRYVVPLDAIQRIVHSGSEELVQLPAGEGHMLKLGQGDLLPVHSLKAAAAGSGIAERDAESAGQRYLFVVVRKQSQRAALLVDELMGQQLVLIRPLRGFLAGIHGVTGCALLGGGDVGMVLDIGRLLNPEA